MKSYLKKGFILLFSAVLVSGIARGQDKTQLLWDLLHQLSYQSSNTWFIGHCASIQQVMDSKTLSSGDKGFLADTYDAFVSPDPSGNPSYLSSYLNRQRPFIISWTSPTDGAVSFSWLKLPKNWDPAKEYPLYIELHGLWSVADDPIEYMTYPFRQEPGSNFAFEDGYLLSPWGRGNRWYQGISETDIWECIAALARDARINPRRMYLCGHSMGGYGAWYIASGSASTWAALGIHAGALWYDQSLLSDAVYESFIGLPVYFVVGTSDQLYGINNTAYEHLLGAGCENAEFVSFEGGHEYLEENVQNMYLWMKNFEKGGENSTEKGEGYTGDLKCTPNPAGKTPLISWENREKGAVSLKLFDLTGRMVREIESKEMPAGKYSVSADFSMLQPGAYISVLRSSSTQQSLRIIISP